MQLLRSVLIKTSNLLYILCRTPTKTLAGSRPSMNTTRAPTRMSRWRVWSSRLTLWLTSYQRIHPRSLRRLPLGTWASGGSPRPMQPKRLSRSWSKTNNWNLWMVAGLTMTRPIPTLTTSSTIWWLGMNSLRKHLVSILKLDGMLMFSGTPMQVSGSCLKWALKPYSLVAWTKRRKATVKKKELWISCGVPHPQTSETNSNFSQTSSWTTIAIPKDF